MEITANKAGNLAQKTRLDLPVGRLLIRRYVKK